MGTKSALLEIATKLAEAQEVKRKPTVNLDPYKDDLRAMMEAGLSLRIIQESLAKIEGGVEADIKTVRKHLSRMHPDLYERKYARNRGPNKKGASAEPTPGQKKIAAANAAPGQTKEKQEGGTDPYDLIRRVEEFNGEPIREELKVAIISECEMNAKRGRIFKESRFSNLCQRVKEKSIDSRSLGASLTNSFE